MSVDDLVSDIINNMQSDGSVDHIQLIEQVGIIGIITELILGFMVNIIIIGLPIVVAIEIMYINFPIIQESIENTIEKYKGNVNNTLQLIIRDARLAVKKANTIETGVSTNYVYFILKCKTVFIAVLVVSTVLGVGPTIVNLISNIAKSFVDGFKMLF